MKEIELLAPAKNLECGIAAIECGADAVYIGPFEFGARSSAANSLDDIEKLVTFAHKFRVKVYVTVNTILSDSQILQAQSLIRDLYNLGADGIIIQDMGLLELSLPPIPLIASTQCNNKTLDQVLFLEKVGFSRVILARELSLEDIKEISNNTQIELEFFIHGSLCVSYSGQCYLSYALGGRSGNRGVCAQPCRKLYSLVSSSGEVLSEKRYLLSLKDLNLSASIKELIEAGITSFKIEGRLKDISYVKNVVLFYRKEIDKVLRSCSMKKGSTGNVISRIKPDLFKTFNRGYTDYFLHGRTRDIISIDTPKSTGKLLGIVKHITRDYFQLDKKLNVLAGDGICFFDENNKLRGTNIYKVKDSYIYPESMKYIIKDILIYRNVDIEFQKKLKNEEVSRKISMKLLLEEKEEILILKSICEDGTSASCKVDFPLDLAKNKDMAISNIKKQLSKWGETEFRIEEIVINTKNIYFIPVKILNQLRRRLLGILRENRQKSYERKPYKIQKNNYPFPEKNLTYLANVMNKYSEAFYRRHGADTIENAAEKGMSMKNKRVMTSKYCLKYQFDLCPHLSEVEDEPLYLIDEKGKKYTLRFDCKDCEMEILF